MKKRISNLDLNIAQLYSSNLSAPLIAGKLGLSARIVYSSLKRQNIQRRTHLQTNRIRFENSPLSFKFKNNLSTQDKELFVAGLMLYYGEGAKTGTTVDFANSDPKAQGTFLNFLRDICGVEEKRLRFYLYCFSDQDPRQLIKFWCKYLNINASSFTKPYVRKVGSSMLRRMPYGVLHIRYSDKRLLDKILLLSSDVLKQFS